MTLSELQTKRDSLLAEIAKANAKLESDAGSVTKRTIDELQKSLAIIDGEIAKLSATSSAAVIGRIYTGEGL